LGSLIELFQERSFAILFVLLLGVPALPLPTGGATHVFEIIAMLLALELIAGRGEIWLPGHASVARSGSLGRPPSRSASRPRSRAPVRVGSSKRASASTRRRLPAG